MHRRGCASTWLQGRGASRRHSHAERGSELRGRLQATRPPRRPGGANSLPRSAWECRCDALRRGAVRPSAGEGCTAGGAHPPGCRDAERPGDTPTRSVGASYGGDFSQPDHLAGRGAPTRSHALRGSVDATLCVAGQCGRAPVRDAPPGVRIDLAAGTRSVPATLPRGAWERVTGRLQSTRPPRRPGGANSLPRSAWECRCDALRSNSLPRSAWECRCDALRRGSVRPGAGEGCTAGGAHPPGCRDAERPGDTPTRSVGASYGGDFSQPDHLAGRGRQLAPTLCVGVSMRRSASRVSAAGRR
ncbi:hypothetical protein BDD21_2636 [Thiocapsa rosea]|uniref:Uncharacterized protein n=1 Tax=Thiocapsa rosea TaxID=69360 RepID=A0A495VA19_9GAMM|nr:hypothetical protein BDD21_2636 [Thiocapsa rosea]